MSIFTFISAICAGKNLRLAMAGVLLILSACAAGPPVQEMSDARQAIAVAREAGASEHAPTDLRAAEDFLDSALRNLSRKDYYQARVDAVEAKNKAIAALQFTELSSPGQPRR
ncbi:MAG: DUF4398 domain-containing protein [Woeseiaceae bacterium]|nr:DUF4398 domain-containing protein [Woeseiaceae bacterium]